MEMIREIQYWWRSLRHGNEIVYPSHARQIFIEVAEPDLSAYSFAASQGRVVRTINPEVTHLIALELLKGSYCLKWGVSLSFVPHSWKTNIRWHRTPNSARFDLFEAPAVASELPLPDFDSIIADGTHGETCLRNDLRRLWKAQRAEIFHWLDSVTTAEAVLEKARDQWRRGPTWHSPSPGLIEAFALAYLGHTTEGREALDRTARELRVSLEPIDNLLAAFEKVATHRTS